MQLRVNTVPPSSTNRGPWENYCWIAWSTQAWYAHQHPGLRHLLVIFPGKYFQHFKVSCTYWRCWFFVAFMSTYITSVNMLLIVVFASLFHLSSALWVVLIKSHIMTNVHLSPSESSFICQIKNVWKLGPKPLILTHPSLPSLSLVSWDPFRMGQGDAHTVQARKTLHPHGSQISHSAGTIMKHGDPFFKICKGNALKTHWEARVYLCMFTLM